MQLLLSKNDGQSVLVNWDNVSSAQRHKEGANLIFNHESGTDAFCIYVQESIEEIMELLSISQKVVKSKRQKESKKD